MNTIQKLELFRDGKLAKNDVSEILMPGNVDISVIVTKDHLIHMLNRYKRKEINKQSLVEWVNGVWFSDSFEYKEDQSSSIASVMSELEELDERDEELPEKTINYYIECLNKNIEA